MTIKRNETRAMNQAGATYSGGAFEALTPDLLRRAFGTYATGIAVIGVCSADGTLVGMTANSFTSVSLSPPLVLFCAARSLSSFKAYSTAACFSASILPAGTDAVANHFARPNSGKWSTVPHSVSETGMPFLNFALACFECQVVARHDAGDHLIVAGQVLRVKLTEPEEPLVFFRSQYRQLDARTRPAEAEGEPPFPVWG